jgi:hypothetical protein
MAELSYAFGYMASLSPLMLDSHRGEDMSCLTRLNKAQLLAEKPHQGGIV